MAGPDCVIGVDFGTLSGRAVVVRVHDGAELGSAVHEYAHGVIERALPTSGARLPAQWALQDPEDWLDVLRRAVPAAVAAPASRPSRSSGSRPTSPRRPRCRCSPTARRCAGCDDLRERPHAYPKLWKHHAAGGQADRINAVARERGEPWLARYGGLISSEWEFAKGLQILEEDPEVYERMERFVEGADWIVWQLCGRETRNTCTAGYKGIFQDGGYPSEDYLRALDERFANFVSEKIGGPLADLGARAGDLTAQAAQWTGLPEGIAVAVGNVDAHVTAPAARAIEAGQMLAVMGTSTCHIMNGDELAEVPGMCGVVRGGRHARAVGLRGRPERRRRHLRLVRRQRRAAALPRRGARPRHRPARSPLRARRRAGGRRARAASPWTGTTATARCSSTTSSAG